tara:strand:+ start:215 stop:685 length:471 start_codon:yes stop_codon:yes gene_type:complete
MRSIYDQAIGVINEILLEELNEIHQNISFIQKELPEIDLSNDSEDIKKLKQFIEDSLTRFNKKVFWNIKPELELILSMIEKDESIETHVIQKKIAATVIRMKSEFLVMDAIAKKLIDSPDDSISDNCKLLRILYIKSLTNMHNCNHAIFDEIDKLN